MERKCKTHLCGVEILGTICGRYQVQNLVVAIVAHLHGIPFVGRHHFLPLVLRYIWKEEAKLSLFLCLSGQELCTYMRWHPWRRDRRWWGRCGCSSCPARNMCSRFAPLCVSDFPETYKLQNTIGGLFKWALFRVQLEKYNCYLDICIKLRKYNCKQILWRKYDTGFVCHG